MCFVPIKPSQEVCTPFYTAIILLKHLKYTALDIFRNIANGQFPTLYPFKMVCSPSLYSTLKNPKCVTPIFQKCNP